MASNSVNAFEGKLLEALSLLPQMGKSDQVEAMRLFGQTAQFFHLQQGQVGKEEKEEIERLNCSQIKTPTGKDVMTTTPTTIAESVADTVLDPSSADLFDDTRLGKWWVFVNLHLMTTRSSVCP